MKCRILSSCVNLFCVLVGVFFIVSCLGLSACSSGGGSHSSSVNEPSLSSEASGLSVNEDKTLNIDKAALGREYLFEGNWANQYVVAEFNAIKTRVVTFRREGSNLYMLESSTGQSVDTTMGDDLLLAEFPIVDETQDTITFDFNAGMSRLFYVSGTWLSDYYGEYYYPNFSSVEVSISFLDWVEIDESGRLSLRQVVRLDEFNDQIAVEYYLSEYQPSATFTPTPTPGFVSSGYFEAEPLLQPGGNLVTHVMKFDTSNGPITFAISSNTPDMYRDAIRAGVNYWNNVMGEGFIQVVDAPEGVAAPDPLYNVIQWVDYDTAPYAYSDFSFDPHTGETLHAQIFLPSVWTNNAYLNTFWTGLLHTVPAADSSSTDDEIPTVGLQGLSVVDNGCKIDMSVAMADIAQNVLASGGSAAEIHAAALDLLTNIVAHELGHALGLRHNFCGSASADLQGVTPHDLFQEYRKAIDADSATVAADMLYGNIASSSVMDYPYPLDDAIWGHLINQGYTFAHDVASMRYLYLNEEPAEWPLFGSDTVGDSIFMDCRIWDYGTPIQYAQGETAALIQNLPAKLLESFISTKAPSPSEKAIEINEMYLYPQGYAAAIAGYREKFTRPFSAGYYYLKEIKEAFPYMSAAELEWEILYGYFDSDWLLELKTARLKNDVVAYFEGETLTAQSVADLLPPLDPTALNQQWKSEFRLLLDEHQAGDGPYGEYSFTQAEQDLILEKADEMLESMDEALIAADVEALSNNSIDVVSGPLGEGLQQALGNIARTYLLAEKTPAQTLALAYTHTTSTDEDEESQAEDETEVEHEISVYIELPVFAYSWEVRKQAIELVRSSRCDQMFFSWGEQQREDLATAYTDYFNTLLEPLLTAMDVEDFTDFAVEEVFDEIGGEIRLWYQEAVYLNGFLD